MRIYIIVIFSFIMMPGAFSQENASEAGEIEEAQIVIEKERDLILPKKERLFKASDLSPEVKGAIPITFSITQPEVTLGSYRPSFRPKSLDKPVSPELYNTEFILGFGNYVSPLLQVTHQNSWNDWDYGITVFHESFLNGPVRDDQSGSSENALQAQAIRSFENLEVKSGIGFSRSGYYYYGYSDQAFLSNDESFIFDKSNWQKLNFSIGVTGNSKDEKLNFDISPEISLVTNTVNGGESIGQEFNFELPGSISYTVDRVNSLGLDLETSITRYESNLKVNRSRVSATPWYKTYVGPLDLKLGLQINGLTDSLENSFTQIGAIMTVGLPLFDSWRLEGGISNTVDENRLFDLYPENYYLDDSLSLQYSITKTPFWAKVGGTVLSNFRLGAGVKIDDIDNAQYFVPSISDTARFALVYDQGELSIFKYYVEATYLLDQSLSATFRYSIFENSSGVQAEAWYRPKSTLSFQIQSQLGRLSLGSSADIVQGLVAPSGPDLGTITLDEIIDINFRADYRFTEQLAVFTQFENIINQSNEYFLNYPTRKITFKIGLRYRL